MPIKYDQTRLDEIASHYAKALKANIAKAPHLFPDAVKANPKGAVARLREHLMNSGFRDVMLRGSPAWRDVAGGVGVAPTQRALDAYLRGR